MPRHTSFSLPSPTETPYRTPSSSLSRRSYDDEMSPSPTPPPLPSDLRIVKKRSSDSHKGSDDNLSPLDPRRFTPTLHASLVSEILSLRRELEHKTKSIDQLEQTVGIAQTQNDSLNKSLLASNKEIRSVKRQMQLLEGGTLSALNDLSKERDDAINESAELRRRLDHAQKRAKNYEDDVDRTQARWDNEKQSWALEKRTLETRSHVMESRLKLLLDEVAVVRTQVQSQISAVQSSPSQYESVINDSAPGSPTTPSPTALRHRRQSIISVCSADKRSDFHVLNLADELALEDVEEDMMHEDVSECEPFPGGDIIANQSRFSSSSSAEVQSEIGLVLPSVELQTCLTAHSVKDADQETFEHVITERIYVDSATQYSRPASPTLRSIDSAPIYEQSSSQDPDGEAATQIVNLEPTVMVSSSCQTSEYLPSPPRTPERDSRTSGVIEKVVMKDISTQTEIRSRPGSSRYIHSRTSTHDLGIPTIAIFPPTSRPTTPENDIVLPPQTKNASCQVDSLSLHQYTSSSVQTEDSLLCLEDILPLSPELVQIIQQSTLLTTKDSAAFRERVDSQLPDRSSAQSSIWNPAHNPTIMPLNDDGPLSAEISQVLARPVRSSSLFAGFDDYADVQEEDFENDMFYEDDYSTRPTAKFTLRSGKLVSNESTLEDIGEITAASAGEAVARDTLKRSETMLPPELRQFNSSESIRALNHQGATRRAPSASRQTSVRRVAMISSGVVVHQSKLSQSTAESASVDGSQAPPIPIPLRYSSARIGKSYSESGRSSRGSSYNTSPTRQYRSKYRPVLRKARSGPAISPSTQSRRPRSKSPPLNSRVSIVPEMPLFQMPAQARADRNLPLTNDFASPSYEVSAPRPSIGLGPRRTRTHSKQPSDPVNVQQTSVVDAIAQTMVGEWMYKYVRRRKSFGKPEKDWDPNKSVEELTSNPASAGVRHKRWVWLAPYERAVMWSSKQPMNGPALLGKHGRKLIVKSVLDIKDDNPMPKNSLTGPAFNRSILILTAERALKFTATNQERHFVWLTALSFLSHSPLSIGDLAALPAPPDEYCLPSPPPVPVGGSFRRRTLRDSIRIAKGSSKHEGLPKPALEEPTHPENQHRNRSATHEFFDVENDAAMPPTIRRFHTRSRSNTAPRSTTNAFAPFIQRDIPPSYQSNQEPAVFERPHYAPSARVPSLPNSRRGSDASYIAKPVFANTQSSQAQAGISFSDSSHNASMTMRMDAFIEHKQAGRGGFKNLRLGGAPRSNYKDLSYWGIEETTSPVSTLDSLTPATTTFRLSDSIEGGIME